MEGLQGGTRATARRALKFVVLTACAALGLALASGPALAKKPAIIAPRSAACTTMHTSSRSSCEKLRRLSRYCQVRVVSSATIAPSVCPSSRSTGVTRENFISPLRTYVWRIELPGVNVTSRRGGAAETDAAAP